MEVTVDVLKRISKLGSKTPVTNAQSLISGMNRYKDLQPPHRMAQFLSQIMHESAGLKYNKEIWGPTAAQKRYEGRKDLGNTRKGDGSKYRGYGLGQLTGRYNVTRFYRWCVKQGFNPPDFVAKPELIALPEWSGLSAVWYWDEGNPTGKSLNKAADTGDIENITKQWNGGLNGYEDRISYYTRAALVFLGYGVGELKDFQKDHKLEVDGIAGPKTRARLHTELVKLTDNPSKDVKAAPVVQPVAVVDKELEKPWYKSPDTLIPAIGTGGVGGLFTAMNGLPWENLAIVAIFALIVGGFIVYRRDQRRNIEQKTVQRIEGAS